MRKNQVLGWLTVGFTYILMVWGNIVSSTGSGLACPDWPTCHGTLTPPATFEIILEWGHRCLAATATILILLTLFTVFRNTARSEKAIHRSGRVLLALLGIQILLGGTTVLLGLSVTISTIHLLIAHCVFAGLILVASTMTWGTPVLKNPSDKMRRLAVSGLAAFTIQLALGGVVRHSHAGLACPQFPACLGSFFPIPFTFETAIAFFHRWWGILLLGVLVHLGITARKERSPLRKIAIAIGSLGLLQVILGILTVRMGLHTHVRATHAALGYALWALLFFTALRSGAFRFLWRG